MTPAARAELKQHVRRCIGYAFGELVRKEPERRPLFEGAASPLYADIASDRFDKDADVVLWVADQLDQAIAARDGWRGAAPSESIGARLMMVVELAKWLVPTFGRQRNYHEEIARLRLVAEAMQRRATMAVSE
jgi:hypothetical protein